VFGRTGAVVAANGDYTTTQVTEGTNLYYTEARVNANTNVAANTAARHAAVTIGTANGLSLSTQALSLAAASTSTTGALTSTDWNTFNGKQAALNGTGFVKISGTTISYDNSTYLTTSSASSTYLPLAGGTLTGALTINKDNILISGLPSTGTNSLQFNLQNNGGAFSVGIDNSTGTYMLASGGLAYASTISTNNATALILGTNLTARLTIASNGAATFSGSITGINATFNGSGFGSNGLTATGANGGHGVQGTGGGSGGRGIFGTSSDISGFGGYFSHTASGTALYVSGPSTFTSTATIKGVVLVGASGGYTTGDNTYINFGAGASPDTFGAINAPFGDKMKFNSYHGYEFKTSNSGSSPVTMMTIGIGGNVLIGNTTDLGGKFQVHAGNTGESNAHIQLSSQFYTGFHWLDGTAYWIGQNSDFRQLRIYSGSNIYTGVYLAAGGSSWTAYSDQRLKENIENIDSVLPRLSTLRTIKYHLKNVDNENSQKRYGLIAQDLVGKFDEVLNLSKYSDENETEYYGVKYTELIPILVKAIQELKAEIDELKNK
jgi:hypothetical protein